MTGVCQWPHAFMILCGLAATSPDAAHGQFLEPDPERDVLSLLPVSEAWTGRTSCNGTDVLVDLRIEKLDPNVLQASITYTPEHSRVSGHLGQKLRGNRSLLTVNDLDLKVATVTTSSSIDIPAKDFRIKLSENVFSAHFYDGACENYPLTALERNQAPREVGTYDATASMEARCSAVDQWIGSVIHEAFNDNLTYESDQPLVEVIAPAFADPYFRDVFGLSYEQMSTAERNGIKDRIEAECVGALEPLGKRELYSLFLRLLAEDPDRPSLAFGYPHITAFIRESEELLRRTESALSAGALEADPRVIYRSMKAAAEDIASGKVYLLPAEAERLVG